MRGPSWQLLLVACLGVVVALVVQRCCAGFHALPGPPLRPCPAGGGGGQAGAGEDAGERAGRHSGRRHRQDHRQALGERECAAATALCPGLPASVVGAPRRVAAAPGLTIANRWRGFSVHTGERQTQACLCPPPAAAALDEPAGWEVGAYYRLGLTFNFVPELSPLVAAAWKVADHNEASARPMLFFLGCFCFFLFF